MQNQHIRNKDNQEIVVYTLPVGQLQTNCYIVAIGDIGYIIDPGDEGDYIAETIQRLRITPQAIFLTHGHFDHVLGAFEVGVAFGIPTYVGQEDVFLVERMQQTAEHFLKHTVADIPPKPLLLYEHTTVPNAVVRVLHTPGHTPGSVCLEVIGFPVVFTGDTLFAGGFVGETNHSYSSKMEMQKSLEKLYALDEKTLLFPGHGESTTLYDIRHVRDQELV